MPSTSTDRISGVTTSAAIKVPCRVATTANITLSGEQTVDGVAVVTGDRVLVKSQTDTTANGIYVADTSGWERARDFNGARDVVTGTIVTVNSGTVNAGTYWRVTTSGVISFGTSAIAFAPALADSAAGLSFEPPGAGAVTRDVQGVLRERVSLLDYIPLALHAAIADGTTADDISSYLQAALTYAVDHGNALHIPAGTYLVSATSTVGNGTGQEDNPIAIIGDGRGTIIKATSTLANGAIRIRGANPEIDASRHFGRSRVEGLRFDGPGRFSMPNAGLGLAMYGVQGIDLNDVHSLGWAEGVKFHNCDLVTAVGCQFQANTTGVATENSGYALGGQLNSFTMVGCWVNNNTQYGCDYHGGLKPTWIGCNFSSNGTSLNISNTAESGATTQSPTVRDCYFESDTGPMIILGGSAGIVTGGDISHNTMLPSSGTTAIEVGNVQGLPRIYDNVMAGAGYTAIDQSTSGEKADYRDGFMQIIPAFCAAPSANIPDVTGDATVYPVIFPAEEFDNLLDYDASTGLFTARYNGKYRFDWSVNFYNFTGSNGETTLTLDISGGSSLDVAQRMDAAAAGLYLTLAGSKVVTLTAGQTVGLKVSMAGPSMTVGITNDPYSWFSGSMVSG